jgi:glycogen operon protein
VLDGRFQARRNLLATVLLSHGVPMVLGGDELCMSQQGNNNAYCQDNELTWLDWSLDEREQEFLEFARHVISVRNAYSALRPSGYVESDNPMPHEPGLVSWRDADGSEMMPGSWGRQEPRILMLTIEPTSFPPGKEQDTLLFILNGTNESRSFQIPKIGKRRRTEWAVVLNTSSGNGKSDTVLAGGKAVEISGCSLIMASAR